MSEKGSYVSSNVVAAVGELEFYNPKANSLPSVQLSELSAAIDKLSQDDSCKVIVLKSAGKGAFCAGASFDELKEIKSKEQGKEFFLGFAKVILSLVNSSKLVITRVQGKVVGGGVGLVSACDYALGLSSASFKLSELAIGLGPFVIGPAVEKKVGHAAFAAMSIDGEWRDSTWAAQNGLLEKVYDCPDDLDVAVNALASQLAGSSSAAMKSLKRSIWQGTEDWKALLDSKAELSGDLVLSPEVQNFLKNS